MNYITDSRSLCTPSETVFVAIKTETGDGHRYVRRLIEQGVREFIVNRIPDDCSKTQGVRFQIVPDTLDELRKRAAIKLDSLRGFDHHDSTVVGITGSRGKTMVKEWIDALIDNRSLRSPRSYNSHIGVPLSILNFHDKDNVDAVLIEVGISQKGEMKIQQETIRPDIVVITNINEEHSTGFQSIEEKLQEKLRLASTAKILVYNHNDPFIDRKVLEFKKNKNTRLRLVSFILENQTLKIIEKDTKGEIKELCAIPFSAENLPIHQPYDIDNLVLSIICSWLLKPAIGPTINEKVQNLFPLITRIDVLEGYEGHKIFVDRFTTDALSMRQVFDYARRSVPKGSKLSVIFYDIERHGNENLDDIINLGHSFGIKQYTFIGKSDAIVSVSEDVVIRHYDNLNDFIASQPNTDNSYIIHSPGNNTTLSRLLAFFEAKLHETILEINLDSLVHNYNFFKSRLSSSTEIICMLKAFGYGTGSIEIAKTMETQGAGALAVAVVDEGIELRRHGIESDIIILNPRGYSYDPMFDGRLQPVVYNFRMLADITEALAMRKLTGYPVHIKLETGMRRLGFTAEELPTLLNMLNKHKDLIRVKSVFSHLATADCLDMDSYTRGQIELFTQMTDTVRSMLGYEVKRHLLNSAGILRFPAAQFDCVRLGIGLYGVRTLPGNLEEGLESVASFSTTIISLKHWKKGESIGYGARNSLKRDSLIATLPVGYADGIDRRMGNGNSRMLVKGVKCPTVGNICMDICMIDVTDVPNCSIGNRVEIFGKTIDINDLAETLNTIPYEILTSVSQRVKRIYYHE